MSWSIDQILETNKRENFYTLLGCSENATEEQITCEYRIRALQYHPDKNPKNESALIKFQQLQEAKAILGNAETRRNYDKWLRSDIAISYKQWTAMNNRCMTTMHWAKPKTQTMIEHNSKMDSGSERESMNMDDTLPRKWTKWEPDSESSTFKRFRNYDI